MKKCFALLTAMFLSVLCGCGIMQLPGNVIHENDYYAIVENEGEYFLRFHDPRQIAIPHGSVRAEAVVFDSPRDMIDSIKSGSVFVSNQDIMRKFSRNSEEELLVFDINSLYEPIFPTGLRYNKIWWYGGDSYSYSCQKNAPTFSLQISSEELINKWSSYDYDTEIKQDSIIATWTVSDRNATVVYYHNLYNEFCKAVRYAYKDNSKDITITEYYEMEVSATIPDRVYVSGSSNGGYFYIRIHDLTERPSYGWITSFGLKAYKNPDAQ